MYALSNGTKYNNTNWYNKISNLTCSKVISPLRRLVPANRRMALLMAAFSLVQSVKRDHHRSPLLYHVILRCEGRKGAPTHMMNILSSHCHSGDSITLIRQHTHIYCQNRTYEFWNLTSQRFLLVWTYLDVQVCPTEKEQIYHEM